ncbi:phage baseplate assembly protein V [Amycolatopsis sp. FBCC-B4732]|uniref:phage baseplate assembly protein V n=1 Tax=Amycolatopsis sp. FBCC-B4732 TaxID=3079339 RepID=UPI001FF150DA|nr:phage baseplate assembly protein V [Amycolatopsis sp. FBCC-B4732]UOX92723.1 phage baseplate assembly protein V [Amycolatopsis sp. FBCC-B4732]
MTAMPRAMATDQRFYGVAPAEVVENDGDDEARVKVKYYWLDGGSSISPWIRVAQLYAGGGYGSVFVPEVGDEVLVAFFQGDMRQPYVLGGLYNGKKKPPVTHAGGRDQKVIRTKAGHRILFDDKEKQVTISTTSGAKVVLKDSGEITLEAATVTVKASGIDLGGGSTEPVVLGNALMQAFVQHTHPVAGAATGPATPLPPTVLAKKVKAT